MDELDRRIAAALQVNGRATWQQVARAVGSTESTVARRAQRMMDAELIRVAAVADPMRCGFGYPVLVQLKCDVGAPEDVAHALAERGDVRFVALITGSFDVVMELIVPSSSYLAQVLMKELTQIDGIRETATESVLRNFKMSYDWSRKLLGPGAAELERAKMTVPAEPLGQPVPLDALDLRLYELLAENGRRSFSELALLLGISESMARRRVEALCSKGCIRFGTLLEPPLLGYDVECFCWIQVELSKLEEIAEALREEREVRYLSATIGNADLICEVILPSQDDLYSFCTVNLGELPGVRSVDIGLELQTVKRAYLRMSWPEREERGRDAVSPAAWTAAQSTERTEDVQEAG